MDRSVHSLLLRLNNSLIDRKEKLEAFNLLEEVAPDLYLARLSKAERDAYLEYHVEPEYLQPIKEYYDNELTMIFAVYDDLESLANAPFSLKALNYAIYEGSYYALRIMLDKSDKQVGFPFYERDMGYTFLTVSNEKLNLLASYLNHELVNVVAHIKAFCFILPSNIESEFILRYNINPRDISFDELFDKFEPSFLSMEPNYPPLTRYTAERLVEEEYISVPTEAEEFLLQTYRYNIIDSIKTIHWLELEIIIRCGYSAYLQYVRKGRYR